MRKIRFGRTNVQVPAISFGTWGHSGPHTSEGISVGWSGHDDDEAKDALVAAHRAEITHWDTADAYGGGRSESLIGELWDRVPREDIFLATKFGWVKGASGHFYDPAFMRAQCEQSLRNLRTDAIDLYYFHHCDFGPNDEYFDDALATMRALRDEGKVRFVGLSDWDPSKIMRFIERVDPDVVQPYRNLVDDTYESSGLKAYVDEHDLGVAFFSPIKQGLLLGKYDAPVQFPEGDVRSRIAGFSDAAFLARMRSAAAAMRSRFAHLPAPVLNAVTGALLADNPTACVLLGQRNRAQVAAAAAAGEALTVEEAAWVGEVYRG
ncbi:MAG TPA: aldo/keto reductase [Thermoanaerobaculia bacterium]|jgi:aryl-alcohol dehydrogenase-like predicted oxidoreductase